MKMRIIDGEPGLLAQLIMAIFGWYQSRWGRKLSFGEMLIIFEEQERVRKLLNELLL